MIIAELEIFTLLFVIFTLIVCSFIIIIIFLCTMLPVLCVILASLRSFAIKMVSKQLPFHWYNRILSESCTRCMSVEYFQDSPFILWIFSIGFLFLVRVNFGESLAFVSHSIIITILNKDNAHYLSSPFVFLWKMHALF